MTLKLRILRSLTRLFITSHYLVKKCLFPIDAIVVWCPTWSKKLGQSLFVAHQVHIFSFRHLEEHYWKKNSWKLTWDKFCITCCFRKVFHLSNTLVINSESLVNRFKPDSIQAMVSKSTLHPLCLIVQARFSFFASHEIELVVIEAEAQWFQIA